MDRILKSHFPNVAQKGPAGLLGGLLYRSAYGIRMDAFSKARRSRAARPATRRSKPGTRPEGVGLSIVFYAKKSGGMRRKQKYVQ